MPPGFRIVHIVDGEVKESVGFSGQTAGNAAMSPESAKTVLEKMLADYAKLGIAFDPMEYTIVPIGEVPFIDGYPPPEPSEPLPARFRR